MNRSDNQMGFSLLEMVVAVAILGISLGILYQSAGGATRSVSTSEDYVYAVNIAQSLLANHSVVPGAGINITGQTSDGYYWSVQSVQLDERDQQPVAIQNIEVSVSWGTRVSPREISLYSVVPVVDVPDDL